MISKNLSELAERFETPLYVYDEEKIRKNYREFYQAFKSQYREYGVKILYAYKANSSLAICHILRQEGAGADVISGGELHTALRVGVKPSDIIFTSSAKTPTELKFAVDKGVIINIDSLDELKTLNKILKEEKKTAKISFRINPSINPKTHPKISTGLKESKFGIHIANNLAFDAYKLATKLSVEIVGVHTHIGSQITETKPFEDSAKKIMDFVLKLKRDLDLELKFIDLGGGLGIPYHGEEIIRPADLSSAITPIIREGNEKLGYEPELWLEPGRYLVGPAGILLTRVQSVKKTPYKKFVNVDAGFNTLLRPAMYDAYHRVTVVNKMNQESTETYDIAGNVCESGDILARDRKLPLIEINDLIAFLDVGAYGFSMTSQYNSRPIPAEILIRKESVEIIRKRGTYLDLFVHQKVPEDLLK